MIDKKVILEELRMLDFIWVGSEIRKWFFGEVIGWNVCSSSIIRKNYTIKRLEEEIRERDLPLEIKDQVEMSNAFQILIKNVA